MTFRDLFEGMHRRDPAIRGAAIAGADGLAVEEWCPKPPAPDLAALCAEMAQILKESSRVSGETGLGDAREFFVGGSDGIVFVRRVTPDYFLLLVASPGAIPGKCRFLLRLGADRARDLL